MCKCWWRCIHDSSGVTWPDLSPQAYFTIDASFITIHLKHFCYFLCRLGHETELKLDAWVSESAGYGYGAEAPRVDGSAEHWNVMEGNDTPTKLKPWLSRATLAGVLWGWAVSVVGMTLRQIKGSV